MPIVNYCSLEEAWGNEYADLYKQQYHPKNKVDYDASKQDVEPDKERDITLPRNSAKCSNNEEEIAGLYRKKNEQKKKTGSAAGSGLTCEDFINHFRNCDKCQKELRGSALNEGFANITGKVDYIDLIIIFLIGIILIFILDCIVRVSKRFK